MPFNTVRRKHTPSIRTTQHEAPVSMRKACQQKHVQTDIAGLRERVCQLPYAVAPGRASTFHSFNPDDTARSTGQRAKSMQAKTRADRHPVPPGSADKRTHNARHPATPRARKREQDNKHPALPGSASECADSYIPFNTVRRKHTPSIRTTQHEAKVSVRKACEQTARKRASVTPGKANTFHQSGRHSMQHRPACERHVSKITCRPTPCATRQHGQAQTHDARHPATPRARKREQDNKHPASPGRAGECAEFFTLSHRAARTIFLSR